AQPLRPGGPVVRPGLRGPLDRCRDRAVTAACLRAGTRRRRGRPPGTARGAAAVVTDRYRRLLVTGGAGFIGSCYVRDVLGRRDDTRITVLDKLTYAGNEANLAPVRDDPEMAARFRFIRGDIADPAVVGSLVADADAVVNVAAETHVDRSILDPEAFLRTGVIGVHVLLEAARAQAAAGRAVR